MGEAHESKTCQPGWDDHILPSGMTLQSSLRCSQKVAAIDHGLTTIEHLDESDPTGRRHHKNDASDMGKSAKPLIVGWWIIQNPDGPMKYPNFEPFLSHGSQLPGRSGNEMITIHGQEYLSSNQPFSGKVYRICPIL